MKGKEKLERQGCSNVMLMPFGLWNCMETVSFVSAGLGSHVANSSNSCMPSNSSTNSARMVTIDMMVSRLSLPRVDYIKLDVEGSEMNALLGGVNTIIKYRPRMAISVYHKQDDIWKIPFFISKLGLNYRFFLGHHQASLHETILYCVP